MPITAAKTIVFTNVHLPGESTSVSVLCENGLIKGMARSGDFTADQTVNLNGGVLYPGFADAHLHLLGLGQSLDYLNLAGTNSPDEIIAQVREKARSLNNGEWIRGRGWDQNDWPDTRMPDRQMLDRVVPDQPVILSRIDGHAVWVNSKALDLAGVDADTPEISGGQIFRGFDNNPSGVLMDNAIELIRKIVPEEDRATQKRQLLQAIQFLNTLGLASVHDAGTSLQTLELLRELQQEGKLTLRVYAMLNDKPEDYEPYLLNGPSTSDPRIMVRAVKLYLDGALGSRGAALLAPYSDDPQNTGLLVGDSSDIAVKVHRFNAAGFQVNIHCIGDRANRMALDIFEKVGVRSCRNRVEHAQIIDRTDIPRFAELGVIPSIQTTHCTSDMYWVDKRLGTERLDEAYPWQSLISSGSVIPGGSDAPIETPNPLWNYYAAVTRQDHKGWPEDGWLPQERMTRKQALNMMTEWPAFAAFAESTSGKVEPGYRADFTVLDRDIQTATLHEILKTNVLFTIVDGQVVYSHSK